LQNSTAEQHIGYNLKYILSLLYFYTKYEEWYHYFELNKYYVEHFIFSDVH